jgi:two-component system response regulator YesN
MIKTMLVDYSLETINYYKNFLKAIFPDIRVVASLNESVEAKFFEIIYDKAPDLIIMDIRFFAMSSLRIIGDVAARYPHIKMLILGTYEDHEYLRATMEKGAADYLYKPIKGREFEICVKKIVKIFEEAKERREEEIFILAEYERNMATFVDRFLANLLSGVLTSEEEIAKSMEYFGMKLSPPYTALTLRIDHFRKVMENMDEKQKHLLVYRVYFAVQKYLAKKGAGYVFINSFNSISCILGGPADIENLIDICAEIKAEVLKKTELSTTIGLGRPKEGLIDVNISAKEADAALRYRYLLGYNTIIPIDFAEPANDISYRYPARKEDLMVHAAVAGEYEYATGLFSQILDTLRESQSLPPRFLPKIVMKIVIAISRYASEQYMEIEARFRDFFNYAEILSIEDIDEAKSYMDAALKSFCGHIAYTRGQNADRMVREIAAHIDGHYYEDITLERFALERRTTSQYLDKIFRERMKMSIKDYLTGLRMRKAREILASEDVEEDIVAARVGYGDVRVFRSVFRRREGLFPSEYGRLRR